MVRYVYDAWGNHKALDSDGNYVTSGIGMLNPFRYRGYYYDTETKLYYLQTRYYDPEVGRFISQDSIKYADPQSINGLNLYAYCGNNPVMGIDPTGTIVLTTAMIIGLAVGVAVGGYVAGSIASANGASGGELIGWILLGVFGGAIIGGALGMLVGWAAPSIGSFLGTSFKLGSFMLATGKTVTVSVTGGQAVAGVLGLLVLLASDPFVEYLKRDMNKTQQDMFKEEIEEIKASEGRGGANNLTKERLREIAKRIKELFPKRY